MNQKAARPPMMGVNLLIRAFAEFCLLRLTKANDCDAKLPL